MTELPDFVELIASMEEELARNQATGAAHEAKFDERAIVVHVADRRDTYGDEVLAEMQMLARSSRVDVVDTVVQHRSVADPSHLLGKGKLSELAVQALCMGANMLMFSCDLTPKQVKKIAEATDLKIIDRTQLILDIFARRAKSRDGKLQVELAQLKYLLPRLVQQDSSMSRLMGGIGGRGPGETKLEIDRRRVRDRIARLEREIKQLSTQRSRKRALRIRRGTPVVALVGLHQCWQKHAL